MTISDLKHYFETVKDPKFFIIDVFSWRGVYDEVAFTPSKNGTREESLEFINKALTKTFEGYKGGEYTYELYTDVHFEFDERSFLDDALYSVLLNYEF